MFGEKKGTSKPAMTDVLSQSNRIRARRRRTKPEDSDPYPVGNPPKKSICTSPDVLAPKTSGPVPVSPSTDCLIDAARLPEDSPGTDGNATFGTSKLSTCPETPNAVNKTMPESLSLYFRLLSTLSCACSSSL